MTEIEIHEYQEYDTTDSPMTEQMTTPLHGGSGRSWATSWTSS